MTVVMAVTDDEFELPVAVRDTQTDMAICLGISEGAVSKAISRGNRLVTKQFRDRVRLVRVRIDEEDEDE